MKFQPEPTEREYHLNVEVVVKKVSYEDEQSTGKLGIVERDMVFLLPRESTQMYQFFSAWLPAEGASSEVVLEVQHPFHQYARAAVMNANEKVNKPHLFLMSYGLSQLLIQHGWNGKVIPMTILPESVDHPDGSPSDQMVDTDLPFEKKEFDDSREGAKDE